MIPREAAVAVFFVVSLVSVPVGGAAGTAVRDDSTDPVASQSALQEQNATVDGAPFLRLDDDREQISGTTTVQPGQNVTVVVSGSGLERSKSVTVTQDGRYSASFDFSNASAPVTVTVDVRANGESILGGGTVPGRIADRPASLITSSQTTDGASVQIRRVNLPDGGFIVAHRGGTDGEVLGVAERDPGVGSQLVVPIEPPINETTEMTLALYRDTNGNGTYDDGDQPYVAEGSAVTAQLSVSVETTTADGGPGTATDVDDGTTTTDSGSATTTPEQTTVDGSGFGALAGLVAVALSAVALAARRRRR